jgi:hypothetical protein
VKLVGGAARACCGYYATRLPESRSTSPVEFGIAEGTRFGRNDDHFLNLLLLTR